MKARSKLLLCGASAATVVMSVALLARPATSSAAAPVHHATTVPTSASTDDAAAIQLAQDEGLSYDDALARIQLQSKIVELDQDLRDYDADFGGLWIDQAHGGQVVVQTVATSSDSVADSYAQQLNLTSLVVQRSASFTGKELQSTYDAVLSEVPSRRTANSPIDVDLDIKNNRVNIDAIGTATASLTTSQRQWVGSLSAHGKPVKLGTHESVQTTSGCDYSYCNAPIRGGVALLQGSQFPPNGYCTEGFNVRSTSDLKDYVTTAGHCGQEYGGTWWEHQYSDNTNHAVGPTWHAVYSGQADALVSVNYPSGWQLPNANVIVDASDNPSWPTTFNDMYAISSTAYPAVGQYLCRTGATSGTACGQVTSVSTGAGPISGQIEVHASVCGGDSGGPVYVGHAAYGVQGAGSDSNGSHSGLNGLNQPCYSNFYATRISQVLSTLNVDLDLS